MNKKGEDFSLEEIVFIIVNILFFVSLLLFVRNTSNGAFVTEQFYAKQIALLIDSSNPGTRISIDISEAYNVAKGNKMDLNHIIQFEKNKVVVGLSGSRIYAYNYFNNVSVQSQYHTVPSSDEKLDKVFLDISLVKNEK